MIGTRRSSSRLTTSIRLSPPAAGGCVLAAGLAFLPMSSCSVADTPGYAADATPSRKLQRVAEAAEKPGAESTRWLIEQLDSQDPAVRLAAITALERRTGLTFGYRYDAPATERETAVRQWTVLAKSEDLETARREGTTADE